MTTEYFQLLDAVEQYYGSGSDQWLEIAKYGITSDKAESILSQVPGVNIVKNSSGKIRSYNFNAIENVVSSTETAVNSNTSPILKSFDVPANTALETVTTPAGETVTNMTFKSGMSKAGNFVFGDVVPAVAAVATGITLGKAIDSLLYNANPDFWDEHGMSTLDPSKWGDIIGTDTVGGRVINTILGTTPDGKTQAYIDQNAFAYMANYLQSKGVFDSASVITSDNTFNVGTDSYNIKLSPQVAYNVGLPKNDTFILGKTDTKKPYTKYKVIDKDPSAKFIWTSYLWQPKYPVARYIVASNKPFKIEITINDNNYNRIYTHSAEQPNEYSQLQGKYPFYVFSSPTAPDYGIDFYPGLLNNIYQYIDGKRQLDASINNKTVDFNNASAFNFLYGNRVTIGGIDGVSNQDGATTPDFSGDSSVDDFLTSLKEQYPDLWNNAVNQDVVQPDGSTVTYTYVPVSMPELDQDGNPVSSTSTQNDPQVNPETATQPLLDLITQIMKKDPPINPPDTGNGNTPSVIAPTGSASALYAIYNPTIEQINSFGSWLWSSDFVEQIKKLFSDPMQAIIGLHKIYAEPATNGTQNIKVGYLDSGISSNVVSNQYTTIDCGTVSLSEYFYNVFDYAPYTDINLYLPFIGIVGLDVADVMRSSINIIYHVDVLSGACLAEVKVIRDSAGGTLYQYTGNASVTLPISSGSYMGIVSSIAGIAGGIAGTIASGGSALPLLASSAGSLLNARTKVEHSGGFSGNAGAMGSKIPYLIISRPQVDLANKFERYIGYPANITTTLESCSGFVNVLECHLENINATDSELNEIESLLKGGIIV